MEIPFNNRDHKNNDKSLTELVLDKMIKTGTTVKNFEPYRVHIDKPYPGLPENLVNVLQAKPHHLYIDRVFKEVTDILKDLEIKLVDFNCKFNDHNTYDVTASFSVKGNGCGKIHSIIDYYVKELANNKFKTTIEGHKGAVNFNVSWKGVADGA